MKHDETVSQESRADLGFGKGGVPWPLMLFYLAFLTFFAWYTLEFQLPDYLDQGPVRPAGLEGAEGGEGIGEPAPE